MGQNPNVSRKKAEDAIARPLSAHELRYAFSVFGAAINYKQVKIHNTEAYFFQPVGTAMSPDGNVYFTKSDYQSDFSTRVSQMGWLIHELTHVWQHQQGMWLRTRAIANRTYEYGDLSESKEALTSYGVEQQASIVEDYFRVLPGQKPRRGTGSIEDYIRIIPFIPGRKS